MDSKTVSQTSVIAKLCFWLNTLSCTHTIRKMKETLFSVENMVLAWLRILVLAVWITFIILMSAFWPPLLYKTVYRIVNEDNCSRLLWESFARILWQTKPWFTLGLVYIETWGYPTFQRLRIRHWGVIQCRKNPLDPNEGPDPKTVS
jgi:hypothetical protein